MLTVYCTKDNHIFETDLIIKSHGISYAIDVTDIANLKAYPLRELTTLGESFDFICTYFPGYSSCNEAAWLDDLDCLIDNECDSERLARLTGNWGSDPDFWKVKREEIYNELLTEAIENYKDQY